jgi:hypothetical protein
MTTNDDHQSTIQPVTNWADLGQEMWSYLTGKGAAVNYEAPRAVWKLNGTLRITTSDDELPGSDQHRA